MITCECGERHADLARFPGDDPGCNWSRLAGTDYSETATRENLEGVMDAAARVYRHSEPASDVAELALLVINLAEALRDTLPEEDDRPTYRDTGDFHRRTSDVVGFSVEA